MELVDELLFRISVYAEKGIDFFIREMLTVEGIVAMVLAFFFANLIVQLRS